MSVRSGARESMPGMMDTVLNLGLNDDSVAGLASRTGDERFAWDCYRRLVQMFGNVVRGMPGKRFEDEIAGAKRERGVKLDVELDTDALRELTERFKTIYEFPASESAPRSSSRRSAPCSTRGWASAPSTTGGSTACRTTGARPSTCSRWCTATRATRPAPGSRSAATR